MQINRFAFFATKRNQMILFIFFIEFISLVFVQSQSKTRISLKIRIVFASFYLYERFRFDTYRISWLVVHCRMGQPTSDLFTSVGSSLFLQQSNIQLEFPSEYVRHLGSFITVTKEKKTLQFLCFRSMILFKLIKVIRMIVFE